MSDYQNITYVIAVIASLLWFAAAFRYFSFQHFAAAKVFVPNTSRHSPLFPTIAVLTRFLGGMNAAFALLSLLLLVLFFSGLGLFDSSGERLVLLIVLGTAHFSQFVFNVPIHRNGGRQGESFWDVNNGPMRFIYLMDMGQATLCYVCALLQAL